MSLFDYPKPYLNPKLWNDGKTLRPEVKAFISKLLFSIFPIEKLHSMTLIGSNVSYQYSNTSDIDVNVMARSGESFDTWHPIIKVFNEKQNYLPGTSHEVHFFFQEYLSETDWSNSLGAYDILQDKWVKNPIPYDKIGDPKIKYEREIAYAKILLSIIDGMVATMMRKHDMGDEEGLRSDALQLAIFFKGIENNRKTAYRYSTGTPALQENNIIHKLVERGPYGNLYKQMIELYDSYYGTVVQ